MDSHMNMSPASHNSVVILASFMGLLCLMTDRFQEPSLLYSNATVVCQLINSSMDSALLNIESIQGTEDVLSRLGSEEKFIR